MKRFCFIVIGCLFLAASAVRAELVSGISVVVNNDVITYGEITDKVAPRMAMLARLYSSDPQRFEDEARKLRDQEIESLIEQKLIVHEFITTGYVTNVLEAFIDDQIKKKIQTEFYGDRARLIKTLEAEGMTYEAYREQQKDDFIVNYMGYQKVDAPHKILISPLKIERYYNEHLDTFKMPDQVRLRMIVIDQPTDAPAGQARKLAEDVLAKIDGGVPFADMAKTYSSGAQKAEGGDYGWVDRSFFRPELAKVAFSLKKGQHSGVIELPEACYIMQVDDTKSSHTRALPDVRAEIERTLVSQERTRLHQQWIQRLKDKSFIQYY